VSHACFCRRIIVIQFRISITIPDGATSRSPIVSNILYLQSKSNLPYRELLRPYESEIEQALMVTDSSGSPPSLLVVGTVSLLALLEAQLKAPADSVHLTVYAPDEWAALTASGPFRGWLAAARVIRILPDELPIVHRENI
jgi:hypothetical protein